MTQFQLLNILGILWELIHCVKVGNLIIAAVVEIN